MQKGKNIGKKEDINLKEKFEINFIDGKIIAKSEE